MKLSLSVFVFLILQGCQLTSQWTKEDKEKVFNQYYPIAKVLSYDTNNEQKKHLEKVTMCVTEKIVQKYDSFNSYYATLPDSTNQKQKSDKKEIFKSFIDCKIDLSGMGYMTLVSVGYLKAEDVPQDKFKEFLTQTQK